MRAYHEATKARRVFALAGERECQTTNYARRSTWDGVSDTGSTPVCSIRKKVANGDLFCVWSRREQNSLCVAPGFRHGVRRKKEKGPVDLFPAEPTDAAASLRGDRLPSVYGADGSRTLYYILKSICVLEQTRVEVCAIILNTFLKARISHGNN